MTTQMKHRLWWIFHERCYGVGHYAGVDPLRTEWNDICRSAGAEAGDFRSDPVPEGLIEIPDPRSIGFIRMSEEVALKILALGEIP
jgi:hypothetical protein